MRTIKNSCRTNPSRAPRAFTWHLPFTHQCARRVWVLAEVGPAALTRPGTPHPVAGGSSGCWVERGWPPGRRVLAARAAGCRTGGRGRVSHARGNVSGASTQSDVVSAVRVGRAPRSADAHHHLRGVVTWH